MFLYLQRILTVLIVGLWFGGFTCYSTFVVKAGSQVVGGLDQGYITQLTTDTFNNLAIIMIVAVIIDIAVSWRRVSLITRCLQLIAVLTMTVSVIVLLNLHNNLDTLLDSSQLTKPDKVLFRPLHVQYQLYSMWLWLATVTYLALMVRNYGGGKKS